MQGYAYLKLFKPNKFPSSLIFSMWRRSLQSCGDQLGSWEKSVTTGQFPVQYKLFISKWRLIKTRIIIWTIETFCWRRGERRGPVVTLTLAGQVIIINVKSELFNFLQMRRLAEGEIMPKCAPTSTQQIWLWRPTASTNRPDGSGAHQTGPAPRLLMGLTLYWYGEIWSVSYNLIFTVGDTSHALPPPSEGSRHVMRT